MPLKKFGPNDIFHNQLEVYPQIQFDIYGGNVYYQNRSKLSGAFVASTPNIPTGFVSLYELNVDRNSSQTGLIYPFIVKNGSLSNFRTISTDSFMSDFQYGATITGSYPLSSSVTREFFPLNFTRTGSSNHVNALQNTLNYYIPLSKHYAFSSSLGDKGTQRVNLISVPSIFYGSSIKKGTVDLKYYISGTLIGRLQDTGRNGELIEINGSSTGSVAGVVLYNEGFVLLTGSWALETGVARDYLSDPSTFVTSSWLYFGTGMNDGSGSSITFVNYRMNFSGSNTIPTVTMLAHANKGEFNYSNNPTFVKYGGIPSFVTGTSTSFVDPRREIKNTVLSPYADPTASFEKITYISKIGIYDEDENLIGVASVATPVKKTLDRNLTFKLKLDF